MIRDRGALSREVGDGLIENVYRLQIMNTQERARELKINATGIEGLQVVGLLSPLTLEPASTRMYTVTLRAPPGECAKGSNRIMFHIESMTAAHAEADEFSLHEKSIFFK